MTATRDGSNRLDWQDDAACRGIDPDLFFPVAEDDSVAGIAQAEEAKQVCADCPVRRDCLAFALETLPNAGIYGGTTPDERRTERRRSLRNRRAA